ncbi:MAG: YggS family pyridoxal phosphate-dependent enzyme [Actinomycetota bacterium]|nr:YggS family pyridoxal phosphate-dependent enzyme [Actinomycetota bacterium]
MAIASEQQVSGVAAGLALVRETVAEAAIRAGRSPSDVQLIAVSKGNPPEKIMEGVRAGQLDYGENRVQEAAEKHELVRAPVRWHFVGRLQRNKVKKLLGFVHAIHSIDRIPLAADIDLRAERPVKVLVEVNVSGEQQKGGVVPADLPRLVEVMLEMPRLEVIGLMTMAPKVGNPEEARPFFRRLARLRAETARRFSSPGIHHLSMGMSQDYVVAVEEGATMLRVGEAIFGPRDRPEPAHRPVEAQGSRKVSP